MNVAQIFAMIVLLATASVLCGQTKTTVGVVPATPVLPVLSALPDAPEKGLVIAYCNICHDLAWIQRSGGSEKGWNERIRRMIRAGATIPPDQIPALAAYLAKALPERPRPAATPLSNHFGIQ
jgi:hypothetical protein